LIIAGTLICTEDLTLNTARGIYAGSPTAAGNAIIEVAENKTATHNGVISDNLGGSAIGADALTKSGLGTLSLGAANTHTGTTTVLAGTLTLGADGSVSNSPTISVRADATLDLSAKASAFGILATQTLTGSGTVQGQSLAVAGNIAPGTAGIGTLGTDAVAMAANSSLTIQINSAAATSDTLAVNGNLTLDADALLVLADIAVAPGIVPNGAKLTLATYTGSLSGTFKDLPENSTVLIGDNEFSLSYADSNAITLTSTNATSADAFAEWIDGFTSLTDPNDKTKGADPDNDGVNNAIEFLIGGDPTSPSDRGMLWVGTSGNQLVLSLAIRGESTVFSGTPSPSTTVEGIECGVEGSLDLSDFTSDVSGTGLVIPSGWPLTPPAGFSYHSFKLDASTGLTGKGFMRLSESH
jgi:autotransporter-associated beta strand protein